MILTKSPVTFCEFDHTYWYEGKRLSGVTSLMRERGVAPDYTNVDETTLERATEYGTKVHQAIQAFCETGEDSDLPEVQAFKTFALKTLANEYLVSDLQSVASSIDIVLEDYSLVDIKTTSVVHTDSVRWQLSIYKYLFELQNPGLKVPHIYCLHLPKEQYGEPKLIELDAQPEANCVALIANQSLPVQATHDLVMQEQMQLIADYLRVAKMANTMAENIKTQVQAIMAENNISKWETSQGVTFTLTKAGKSKTFDSTRFKKDYPKLAEEYTKETERKSSLRVTIK